MKQPSPYELLGVTKDVTLTDLKRRYRELAFQLHPDRNPAPDAGEQFARVSVAYEYLLKKLEGGPATSRVSKAQQRGSTPRPSAKCRKCRGTKKVRRVKGFYVGPWERCPSC